MINNFSVLAVVLARGGSKRLPGKNIKLLAGKPLIGYAIEAGLKSQFVDRVILSTDDQEIAKVGKEFGAEIPFIRPAELATDQATDYMVFEHAVNWFVNEGKFLPDIIVQLRPTSPLRTAEHIDLAIKKLVDMPESDSVRTVTLPDQTPYKMFRIEDNGFLKPLFSGSVDGVEYINMPSQKLPVIYKHVGYVDVFWRKTLLEKKSMTGERIAPVVLDTAYSGIDDQNDWDLYEYLISKK